MSAQCKTQNKKPETPCEVTGFSISLHCREKNDVFIRDFGGQIKSFLADK